MADVVERLRRAVMSGEDGCGTLPAKESVKVRPADWHSITRLAREAATEIETLRGRLSQAGAGGGVPNGWQLVQIEPAWNVLIEGRDALMDTDDELDLSTDQIRECYRVMLAGMPKPLATPPATPVQPTASVEGVLDAAQKLLASLRAHEGPHEDAWESDHVWRKEVEPAKEALHIALIALEDAASLPTPARFQPTASVDTMKAVILEAMQDLRADIYGDIDGKEQAADWAAANIASLTPAPTQGDGTVTITTNGTTRVIPAEEPVFLIRGQDAVGHLAVRAWAVYAETAGADAAIVATAREHAAKMEAWPKKKVADLPNQEDGQ